MHTSKSVDAVVYNTWANVLGNFKFRGVQLIWIIVGQGPTVLAVGLEWLLRLFFSLRCRIFFVLSLSGRRPDID